MLDSVLCYKNSVVLMFYVFLRVFVFWFYVRLYFMLDYTGAWSVGRVVILLFANLDMPNKDF